MQQHFPIGNGGQTIMINHKIHYKNMKKLLTPLSRSFPLLKFSLKMKLSMLFMLVSLLTMQANTSYGQRTKISLNLESVSVSRLIDEIESKFEFRFVYKVEDVDLDRIISVNVKKEKIDQVLNTIFSGTKTTFDINDRRVYLIRNSIENKSNDGLPPIPEMNEENLQMSVSGMVNDSAGNPLPGASIVEKGTSNGTTSDFDGNFAITVSDGNATLVVSYIGFETKEVAVNDQTNITVQLEESSTSLDEVVLVGYGQQQAKDVTSAISTVDVEEATKFATYSPDQFLQGRTPGVNVTSTDGSIGGNTSIVIRGIASFTNSNPLFVIDGTFTDNMNFLNPQDIESIQVLKDASATAIYGSRAANGVIIISTKKGRAGEAVFDVSLSRGVQGAAKKMDFLNAREFADLRNQVADANGGVRAPANDSQFDPSIDTDWQDLQLESNAPITNVHLGVSGGTSNFDYSVSANYFDQQGIIVDSRFNRFTTRAKTGYKKNRFSFNQSIVATREVFDLNNSFLPSTLPTVNPFNPDNDGGFGAPEQGIHGATIGGNPFGLAKLIDDEMTRNTVLANLNAGYEILDGLTYKINFGANLINDHKLVFRPTFFLSDLTDGNRNDNADLEEGRRESLTTLFEHTLNYNKSFGDHNFDVIAGYTRQETKLRGIDILGTDFPSNDLNSPTAAISKVNFGGDEITSGLISYFGRLNYNYKNRYLVSASMRRDGSSRFGSDNRYGNFSSVSAGWRISDEAFFDIPAITDLKVRAGLGTVGSQNIADFATTPVISTQSEYNLGSGVALIPGAAQLAFANSDLKWEETKTTNIGLDLELWSGKFATTVEYYIKDTKDILLNIPIASSTGSSAPLPANAASIKNKGLEVSMNYRDIEGDFTYNIGANFAFLNNEVTSLGQGGVPINFDASRTEPGQAVGSFYGLIVDGVFQTQAEIDAHSANGNLIQPLAQVGDFRFRDLSGDGQISADDRNFIGSPIPDVEFGLNFSAKYKQFDFSLFFQGTLGNDIFNGLKGKYYLYALNNGYLRDFVNDSSFPRLSDPGNDANQNELNSSFYVEDGSYGRLRSLQIGYTFQESILSKVGISSARVYLSGQNLFTLSGFVGYNPEIGIPAFTEGGSPSDAPIFTRGLISINPNQPHQRPLARTFILGIDFKL